MKVNPKYIQIAGDAVIPVLGFFWWNWSLYFIVLFYLLDYLSNEFFLHFKSFKISKHLKSKSPAWIKQGFGSFLMVLGAIVLMHFTMLKIHPNMNFNNEIVKFWNYKDMGFEQGYLLLPLIGFVGYFRYKMEFLVPRLFEKQSITQIWKPHFYGQFYLIGFIALTLGISQFVVFSEVIYLIAIVSLLSVFQLIQYSK